MEMGTIINQPVIETDRFRLRPLRRSDTAAIAREIGDQRVARATPHIPHPLPQDWTADYVARAQGEPRETDVWAMDGTDQGNAAIMGLITLTRLDRNQSEVSYWVAPSHWNTGLASDALKALVTSNPLNNDTMFASVFHDNPASARVLTHCGFAYLGDAELPSLARHGAVPTWTYIRKL